MKEESVDTLRGAIRNLNEGNCKDALMSFLDEKEYQEEPDKLAELLLFTLSKLNSAESRETIEHNQKIAAGIDHHGRIGNFPSLDKIIEVCLDQNIKWATSGQSDSLKAIVAESARLRKWFGDLDADKQRELHAVSNGPDIQTTLLKFGVWMQQKAVDEQKVGRDPARLLSEIGMGQLIEEYLGKDKGTDLETPKSLSSDPWI